MKNILTLFLLLFISLVNAQNWSPILVNEKMNFQHSDSVYITSTIWVDSSFYYDDDSIFYLNRIVKDVDGNPEIALRNQPQFLSNFIVKQEYGIYVCADPYNYIISTQFGLGSTWTFNSLNNIQAEVTEVTQEEIFGVLDSVQVISLSDGNEIRLSKNFGILLFPDYENSGYFELVGIQGTEYGESVPGFWEIFDFEVGDVFQYDIYDGGPCLGYIEYSTLKYTIVSKEVTSSYVSYETNGIRAGTIHDFEYSYYSFAHVSSLTYTYNLEDYYYSNYFNNTIIEMWDLYIDPLGTGDIFSKYYCRLDSNNLMYKKFGLNLNEFQGNLYYVNNEESDTLIMIPDPIFNSSGGGFVGSTLKESLGVTQFLYETWEDRTIRILEGYIKDGDTLGIITPDSTLLLLSTPENGFNKNHIIELFPNPANRIINIKLSSDAEYNSLNFEIRNLQGQIVKEKINLESENIAMTITDLPSGLYLYIVKDDDLIIQQGKLIVQ